MLGFSVSLYSWHYLLLYILGIFFHFFFYLSDIIKTTVISKHCSSWWVPGCVMHLVFVSTPVLQEERVEMGTL